MGLRGLTEHVNIPSKNRNHIQNHIYVTMGYTVFTSAHLICWFTPTGRIVHNGQKKKNYHKPHNSILNPDRRRKISNITRQRQESTQSHPGIKEVHGKNTF